MANNIADNEELANRIKAFVGPLFDDGEGGMEPSPPKGGQSVLQSGQFPAFTALSSVLYLVNFFMLT